MDTELTIEQGMANFNNSTNSKKQDYINFKTVTS